jgi:hypothetical protein
MKELPISEMREIKGGWLPVLVAAGKLLVAGISTIGAATAIAFGVGYYDAKKECEEVCTNK